MATILLIIIYIDFIGLGIPDSLLGAAWPAIYTQFSLPMSYAGIITITVSCFSFLSSLFSVRIIKKIGTGGVALVSTFLTAVGLLGFSLSKNFLFLIPCAIPLGIGAGAIDVALNNYVALHYSAIHMNFLHCAYGVGVTVSPLILSIILDKSGWQMGYRTMFYVQLCITIVTLLSLPLWNRIKSSKNKAGPTSQRTLSLKESFAIRGTFAMCLMFFGCCCFEFVCGTWGATFLVEYKDLPVSLAARTVMYYYIGMTLGRFLSGILSVRMNEWKIITIGQITISLAILLLALPVPYIVSGVGLFLAGLGNGPMYPNLIHATPDMFGVDVSASVIGIESAAGCLSSIIAPPLFGVIAQNVGMGLFPFYILAAFLLFCIAGYFVRKNKKAM